MHRFYIEQVDGDTVAITETAQFHHLKDVLRLKTGERVSVFDGAGNEYDGAITAIGEKQAIIKVKVSRTAQPSQVELAIACAIPKGDRMDEIIDQLTQLGVVRIIPMLTERVVVKLDVAKKASRLERWRAIAQSAAAQSQRHVLPTIEPVTGLADVISRAGDYDLKLIPHLSGERRPLKDAVAGAEHKRTLVLIGPEGDFTPEEVALAIKAGFLPVSLGDTVLRVATAAVAVASYIKLALVR